MGDLRGGSGESRHGREICIGVAKKDSSAILSNMEDLAYVKMPPQLALIMNETTELQFDMASEPLVGTLLRTLAASKPAGRFLELGTGTGIATAWLLAGMDAASTFITVDVDPAVQAVARKALGNDPRLSFILSDGIEFLRSQQPESFDLVFADAMPGKYEGLDEALRIVRVGGFYIIDDMLPQQNWPEGHAEKIPVLMERLAQQTNFEILPLVWSSGVAVAVRRKRNQEQERSRF
jgi:predicted O-methyltransferase YrrM